MGALDGRVAIVTGAGRGLGRAYALALAADGAAVVVNDVGASLAGERTGEAPADAVVAEIRAAGGTALASPHDVGDWEQARALVELAVRELGELHVLVNNAGIVRDRTLANMSEAEWDAVLRVNLKGSAATSRHALAHWRERAKAGRPLAASVVHTASVSGLVGNFGQANYAAAKLGVVALSRTIALEGERHGVRSNVISPSALTRLALSVADDQDGAQAGDPAGQPENNAPLVAWLARADCPANAQVFQMSGNRIYVISTAQIADTIDCSDGWTVELLERELPARLARPLTIEDFS